MKRRYTQLLFTLLVLLCILVTGCKEQGEIDATLATTTSESMILENEDGGKESEVVATLSQNEEIVNGIDRIRIEEDLLSEGLNTLFVNYEEIELDVESLEIIRARETEDGTEIHIAVTFSNEYYVTKLGYILFYSYYDVGGWYLDDYSLTDYSSYAVKNPVSDNDFYDMMMYHFDSYSITSRSTELDEENIYHDFITFTATVDYDYLTVQFEGEYAYEFFDGDWHMYDNLWITGYDWSQFLGTFRYRDESINMGAGFYSVEAKVTIDEIQQVAEDKLLVTYSGSTYLYDKTLKYLEVDEAVSKQSKEIRISTDQEIVFGYEVNIPQYAGCIFLPWEGTSQMALYLNCEEGIYSEGSVSSSSRESFTRIVSEGDLQDAMDKLEGMNP